MCVCVICHSFFFLILESPDCLIEINIYFLWKKKRNILVLFVVVVVVVVVCPIWHRRLWCPLVLIVLFFFA